MDSESFADQIWRGLSILQPWGGSSAAQSVLVSSILISNDQTLLGHLRRSAESVYLVCSVCSVCSFDFRMGTHCSALSSASPARPLAQLPHNPHYHHHNKLIWTMPVLYGTKRV